VKIGLLVTLFVAAILSSCAGNPNEVGEMAPYINPDLGFRIDYPSNWSLAVDPESLVGPKPDRLHVATFVNAAANTAVIVYVQTLDTTETLEDYTARQVKGILSNATEADLSDPAPAKLGGLDALMIETASESNGQRLRTRLVLAVKGTRGYALSLTAPVDSPLGTTLDDVLASFGILP